MNCTKVLKLFLNRGKVCLFLSLLISGFAKGQVRDENPSMDDFISPESIAETVAEEPYVPNVTEDHLIADRLSCIKSSVPLTFNQEVKGFIKYFTEKKPGYTRLMLARKAEYFPIFERYLKKHGMPDEIKYLSIVESGLKPGATSRVGAAGLWQFMPSTGKLYKLNQDQYIDERRDPHKSTEAACRYLKELYSMFGDWQLALASYNCGGGRVRRALNKTGGDGTFWDVYRNLPAETRAYVPQFIAVTYVMNYAKEYGIYPEEGAHPILEKDTLLIDQYLDLELLAKHGNMSLEELQRLNPELRKNVVPEYAKNYALKIPKKNSEFVFANLQALLDSASVKKSDVEPAAEILLASEASSLPAFKKVKRIHIVRKGETLSSVARKYGVSMAQLRSWNRVKKGRVMKGQALAIWKSVPHKEKAKHAEPEAVAANDVKKPEKIQKGTSVELAKNSVRKELKNTVKRYYTVRPGDTLFSIAKKKGVSLDKLRALNRLKGNKVRVGQKLVIS